ncbi:MAG TPA: helix-turn-helix domain-containing protein [Labilithrix sp.]|nr:helix-turn-helix domain-containing protein [Labilithrix sp.]
MAFDDLPESMQARLSAEPGAAAALASTLERAAAELPSLRIEPAALAAYLLDRAPAEGSLAEHLEKVRAGDLLLAAACARGDAAALAIFEQRYSDEVPMALARIRTTLGIDEVRQSLRDKLFVADEGAAPKITLYSGTGDLRSWFRVTIVRMLLNVATRGRKEVALEDAMLEALPGTFEDAELAHARTLYGPALAEAFGEAIARLERRERSLLRYAVCDGLTVDAIGKIYGVHRATAARWVQAARERLENEVLDAVRARIPAGDDSIASIMRLLASQVDISLRVHLATEEAPVVRVPPGGLT